MLAKLLNPPSVVKAESRMTQLHAVEKASPWASKFGWFNHGRCQKAMALRGMKDNVRYARHACSPLSHYTVLLLCKPSCNAMMVSFEMNCEAPFLRVVHDPFLQLLYLLPYVMFHSLHHTDTRLHFSSSFDCIER